MYDVIFLYSMTFIHFSMSFEGKKLHFSMDFCIQKLHFSIIFLAAKIHSSIKTAKQITKKMRKRACFAVTTFLL